MRAALLILLGLVIGILVTVNVMNNLAERHPMPKAIMHTMGYHMGELSHALKTRQCAAADIQHHLERMQSTATDIEPVFGINEKPFHDDALHLQQAVAQALQANAKDCPALAAVIKPIGHACKSCHDKYR